MKKSKLLPVFMLGAAALAIATLPGCKGPTDPDVGGGGGNGNQQTLPGHDNILDGSTRPGGPCHGGYGNCYTFVNAGKGAFVLDSQDERDYIANAWHIWNENPPLYGHIDATVAASNPSVYTQGDLMPCWTWSQIEEACDMVFGMGRSQGRMSIIR